MATVSPAWEVLLEGECAPIGTPLFQPVATSNNVAVVAGGPLKLSISRVHKGSDPWFEVPAQFWISGFDVHGDSLYVQDGPVISRWDLTTGDCRSAMNLVSGAAWEPAPAARALLQRARFTPPEWIYELDPEPAALHERVLKIRRVMAWIALLEAEDYLWSIRTGEEPPVFTGSGIGVELRRWLGSSREVNRPDQFLLPILRVQIDKKLAAVSSMLFSAPVVRKHPHGGELVGGVFVINGDGTLFSLDAGLTHVVDQTFEAPARPCLGFDAPPRPQLAMEEEERPSGHYGCRLYYVDANGGVQAIDGDTNPPRSLPGWAPIGQPRPDYRQLPLRCADRKLYGGGIFEAGFFVAGTNPPGAPFIIDAMAEAPASWKGWRDYDLAIGDEVALLNSGRHVQQMGIGPNAAGQWGGHDSQRAFSHSLYWNKTGKGNRRPSRPLVALVVEGAGSGKPACRVFLAGSGAPLYSGNITKSTSSELSEIAWIRSKPVVADDTIYCVARTIGFFDWMKRLTKKADGQPSKWDEVREALKEARRGNNKTFIEALEDVPLPALDGEDGLIALPFGEVLANI